MILSIRSRIEFLEEFLDVPTHEPSTGKHLIRRDERWLTYFDTKEKDGFAVELKKRIEAAGSNVETFCKSLQVLYGDFSDRAAHRVPLPDEVTDEDINNVLKQIGVYKDKPVKAAIIVLIEPLDGEEKKNHPPHHLISFSRVKKLKAAFT